MRKALSRLVSESKNVLTKGGDKRGSPKAEVTLGSWGSQKLGWASRGLGVGGVEKMSETNKKMSSKTQDRTMVSYTGKQWPTPGETASL